MTDYVPNAGDVVIAVEGKTLYTLKPSLAACLKLSRSPYGSLRTLTDKCIDLDFDAITYVVAAGTDRQPDETLQEEIYTAGTINIFAACARYLHIVSRGGRPATEGGDGGSGATENPPIS